MEHDTLSAFKKVSTEQWGASARPEIMDRCCEDKSVGVITRRNDNYSFSAQTEFKYESIAKHGETRRLVLVLESPHVDEFVGNKAQFAPARGATGRNIRTHISEVLSNRPDLVEVELILMNAVQYQCSQGKPLTGKDKSLSRSNGLKRDEVFRQTFHNGEEFSARLREIVTGTNDIVINCCSKGSRSPYLRKLVGKSIDAVGEDGAWFESLATCHPSVWFNEKLRKLREKR